MLTKKGLYRVFEALDDKYKRGSNEESFSKYDAPFHKEGYLKKQLNRKNLSDKERDVIEDVAREYIRKETGGRVPLFRSNFLERAQKLQQLGMKDDARKYAKKALGGIKAVSGMSKHWRYDAAKIVDNTKIMGKYRKLIEAEDLKEIEKTERKEGVREALERSFSWPKFSSQEIRRKRKELWDRVLDNEYIDDELSKGFQRYQALFKALPELATPKGIAIRDRHNDLYELAPHQVKSVLRDVKELASGIERLEETAAKSGNLNWLRSDLKDLARSAAEKSRLYTALRPDALENAMDSERLGALVQACFEVYKDLANAETDKDAKKMGRPRTHQEWRDEEESLEKNFSDESGNNRILAEVFKETKDSHSSKAGYLRYELHSLLRKHGINIERHP